MSKYDPLRGFLESIPPDVEKRSLSFSRIESIIGAALPASARKHRAWWSNPTSRRDHPHAQAWLAAGWKVDTVDQEHEWVRFRRTSSRRVVPKTTPSGPEMTTYERGVQIYQVLICAAHHRQTLTYPILADLVGLPRWGLGPPLDHIQEYCRASGLPPLTVLVVQTHGGVPSSGFHGAQDADAAREAVFAHDWFGMRPVAPDLLEYGV